MISVKNVSQVFQTKTGSVHALDDISFHVAKNEFVALVGRSGCGKSTLLRAMAGLISPTSGGITIDGTLVEKPRQDISFMLQSAALLPWRTVLGNVLYPIEIQGKKKHDYLDQAHDLLKLVGLDGFEKKSPKELSGGMQQRVSLVRSLITNPSVMLMDEPFSALDALTRTELSEELQRVQLEKAATIVFVTHSIEEAVLLADRVVVLSPRPGRLYRTIEVNIPRPRTLGQNENSEKVSAILAELHEILMSKDVA